MKPKKGGEDLNAPQESKIQIQTIFFKVGFACSKSLQYIFQGYGHTAFALR